MKSAPPILIFFYFFGSRKIRYCVITNFCSEQTLMGIVMSSINENNNNIDTATSVWLGMFAVACVTMQSRACGLAALKSK